MNSLKKRENICFYDDVVLYEDELSDNGCSVLSVKIVSSADFYICTELVLFVVLPML